MNIRRVLHNTVRRSARRLKVGGVVVRRSLRRVKRQLREPNSADSAWYDSVYRARPGVYIDHYSDSPYLDLWRVIVRLVPAEAVVLEIGCGTGQLAELFYDSGIRRYTGFDFSRGAVEIAMERLPNLTFHVADARTSVLVEMEADVVVCTEVLEHITEDIDVIRRIPTGTRFIGTVPDFDSETHVRFFSSVTQVQRRYGHLFSSLAVSEHVLERVNGRFFLLDGVRGG